VKAALLLAGSYLAGSISFSLVVVWLLRRVDLRTLGSGNAGATNVLRTSGRWPALLVLALDIAKGYLPVAVAKRLGFAPELVGGAALAAVLGHVFPIFFGFRGGRGVATGFGALLALFPLAAGAAVVVFVVTVLATRYVSVGSVVAALAVPPLAWGFGAWGVAAAPSPGLLAMAALCVAVVVARHASNLRRLVAGTEQRIGERGSR
jgi:glycerol-3-phosphate acyltransferase PlsY